MNEDISLHPIAKFLICFIINSESSSNLFRSELFNTTSDLLITNISGIPQLIFKIPSFKGSSSFNCLDSSESISFFRVFSSSSNCGSSYNFKCSITKII